jgi:hypothetical protein
MTPPHFNIFVIISPAGSEEEDFKKNFSVFLLFRYYLPSGKGYPFHLNKLKNPLHPRMICAKSG